jgi:hypothetical protein
MDKYSIYDRVLLSSESVAKFRELYDDNFPKSVVIVAYTWDISDKKMKEPIYVIRHNNIELYITSSDILCNELTSIEGENTRILEIIDGVTYSHRRSDIKREWFCDDDGYNKVQAIFRGITSKL